MLITKSSLRVSLVGGGSDLPSYIESVGYGTVISFPINKHIYITSNDFHIKDSLSFKYSILERCNSPKEFKNPLIKETFNKFFPNLRGREFGSFSEIPGGSGLGSSSSFTGNLIYHLGLLKNLQKENERIARDASDIEINILNEPIGKQDHYGCLVGGLKQITFYKDKVEVSPIQISKNFLDYLNENMILVKIGEQRSASKILGKITSKKSDDISKNAKDLIDLVDPLKVALTEEKITDVNMIINEGWDRKKEMSSEISNGPINEIYEYALANGASSGKLCGAGGSGYMFFLCNNKQELLAKLKQSNIHEIHIEDNPLQNTTL